MIPERTRTFSLEDVDSELTGHAAGTEALSFLASGVFAKLPIGKFQVIIFMSCALDQICAS